ncbi:hypothetical protein HGP16_32990 [Rhizobium sp. P40RR-XXII]|uniref:carbamoyltransferase N-terminal domain-containing protein n=1 Tax=unclassified Rhizobium TaxID=2613769 RepID=UPI0014567834|nr:MULTISPECIES: carbamoyltransferase N-terminal domain-containing protein [unclassified Rhizobium]NLR88296.1 hypothetical protein [Rhizobium sp. P28RR-XV]NLS21314.1 hypothetical protein [Rhizobium sp. P40RR-XXII]
MVILGISCFYHDSAAAITRDGKVLAAAQEERFTRIRHDSSFPGNAIRYCLEAAGLELRDVELVVYYENSRKKLSRIVSTIMTHMPSSLDMLSGFLPEWWSGKYSAEDRIRKELRSQFGIKDDRCRIREVDHHLSHAASAFFPSPFDNAAILVVDG